MTRGEHLQWAKRRALKYVEIGELTEAVTSMLSDLSKHPELKYPPVVAQVGLLFRIKEGPEAVRRWIEGFN